MDSGLGDSFVDGRRLRPATLEYALANYPRVVIWLKLNKLTIDARYSCDGRDTVNVRGKSSTVFDLTMVRSDFNKLLSISHEMTVPLFISDIESDWFERAKAHIRLHF